MRRRSGSKKIGCPFKLVGVYNEKRLVWQLEVRNDEHNHEAAQHLEGHPFVRRLSQDEQKMVAQLTEQHMDPRNILSTIKKQNPDNVSVIRDIYNAQQKIKNEKKVGTTPMQVLENLLHSKDYVYYTREDPATNAVEEVFFFMSSGSDAEGDLAEHPILQFPEGSTAFGRCAKFRTMRIGRQKAIDWDVLTEIGERERAERWIGEETPWRRLFELAFQPSYREVVVEFLSTFTFRPRGVPEVVFSMLRQRHEMSLAEFAVITGLYWEPETVTPLYTAGITEIDDATLRAWWPHIADDPFRGTKARNQVHGKTYVTYKMSVYPCLVNQLGFFRFRLQMSSNRGANKGKNIAGVSNFDANQLNQEVQDVKLGSSQDGGWEVISKKNKNRPGNVAAATTSQNPKPNQPDAQRGGAWVNAPVRAPTNVWGTQTGGRGGANSAVIPPPLQSGWNWNSRPRQTGNNVPNPQPVVEEHAEDDNEDEEVDDSDDDLLSDEYDSDEIPKTHEERKKNKLYADFFGRLDTLTIDQINEPTKQWHCPACQKGRGAIAWYKGLLSLVAHAKTKGSKRVKIHRDLAIILEEELRIRGATINPAGESSGQWKGLDEVVKDKEIIWPPMVVIMNTQLEQDESDKWLGMGNQELLDYFGPYEAVRARHSYGPKGHRGMSVLIFEASAVGYTEAERLSKHFEDEGMDREACDRRPTLFYPGGKRRLYGYMATKGDMDNFNQHSPGKSKLKFELVSYQEKVVNQLKLMHEDNQQLHWYKDKVVKEKMHSKALEESYGLLSQKLRKTEEENRIVRERTQLHHEQNKEEMDYQEQFIKDQLKVIQDARNAREGHFDKLLQENAMTLDPNLRDLKLEEMKKFEEEREKLMQKYEEKIAEMKNRHRKEQLEIEEGFNGELNQLMNSRVDFDSRWSNRDWHFDGPLMFFV
ncbi:hypothetical protein E3N88_41094 [Mikania micrantha]|uniref:XS domain-containing protein n=1 Tax=Mikania micrantha TaxID=192012 RepID=A0A5N6LPK2_9ASTR|nr:hypothetical protein E3N88_41094 [Mikania micrantha]